MKILFTFILLMCAVHTHYTPSRCRSPELLMRIEKQAAWELFIFALIEVESGGDSTCIGMANDVGILQITPICVREVNRILGMQIYVLSDRYSVKKSLEMFNIIQHHKNPQLDIHLAAKIWNPRAPESYYEKIERNLLQKQLFHNNKDSYKYFTDQYPK